MAAAAGATYMTGNPTETQQMVADIPQKRTYYKNLKNQRRKNQRKSKIRRTHKKGLPDPPPKG